MTALPLAIVATVVLAVGLRAQDAGSPPRTSIVKGVFTAGQAFEGRQLFERACSSCHKVTEHAGRKFAARWESRTLGDLFELLSDTMPEGDPGSLKPEEYASIIAFFLKESGYQEGEKTLPYEVEALKKIGIEPLPQ